MQFASKIIAIINLRNAGGGIPDGGLFTAPQFKSWDTSQAPGTSRCEIRHGARVSIDARFRPHGGRSDRHCGRHAPYSWTIANHTGLAAKLPVALTGATYLGKHGGVLLFTDIGGTASVPAA